MREYGRGVGTLGGLVEVDALSEDLLGVGPNGGRPPRTLCERCRAGVGAKVGCFLNGDSGRGKEGRFDLNIGLVGRAPGPTDCENLCASAGVGGVRVSLPVRVPLIVLYDGVLGVAGYEPKDADGEERFSARMMGKNMPAPRMAVLK